MGLLDGVIGQVPKPDAALAAIADLKTQVSSVNFPNNPALTRHTEFTADLHTQPAYLATTELNGIVSDVNAHRASTPCVDATSECHITSTQATDLIALLQPYIDVIGKIQTAETSSDNMSTHIEQVTLNLASITKQAGTLSSMTKLTDPTGANGTPEETAMGSLGPTGKKLQDKLAEDTQAMYGLISSANVTALESIRTDVAAQISTGTGLSSANVKIADLSNTIDITSDSSLTLAGANLTTSLNSLTAKLTSERSVVGLPESIVSGATPTPDFAASLMQIDILAVAKAIGTVMALTQNPSMKNILAAVGSLNLVSAMKPAEIKSPANIIRPPPIIEEVKEVPIAKVVLPPIPTLAGKVSVISSMFYVYDPLLLHKGLARYSYKGKKGTVRFIIQWTADQKAYYADAISSTNGSFYPNTNPPEAIPDNWIPEELRAQLSIDWATNYKNAYVAAVEADTNVTQDEMGVVSILVGTDDPDRTELIMMAIDDSGFETFAMIEEYNPKLRHAVREKFTFSKGPFKIEDVGTSSLPGGFPATSFAFEWVVERQKVLESLRASHVLDNEKFAWVPEFIESVTDVEFEKSSFSFF